METSRNIYKKMFIFERLEQNQFILNPDKTCTEIKYFCFPFKKKLCVFYRKFEKGMYGFM